MSKTLPFDFSYRRQAEPISRLDILLAEDNASCQKVMALFLSHLGHRLTIADNGRVAVALCGERDFDMVLLDVAMPEMDGLSAAISIRSLPGRRAHVPIFALTARAFPEDVEACLVAGMDGVFTKPLALQALADTLMALAGGRPAG
jgi:two-component system sensor histidine kinase/response regulator